MKLSRLVFVCSLTNAVLTKVDTLGEEGVCDVENSASHTGCALLVYYCIIFGSHVSPLYCLSHAFVPLCT